MYLGIDLGTSSIKVILMHSTGEIVDSQSSEFEVLRPKPLWSEQEPEDWFDGLNKCMKSLGERQNLRSVTAIGLSGQMHGATLLDQSSKVIRPAILWNDGRSSVECRALEEMVPAAREITGNLVMPGFTAPKLLWLKN